jgi:hypothetical protein
LFKRSPSAGSQKTGTTDTIFSFCWNRIRGGLSFHSCSSLDTPVLLNQSGDAPPQHHGIIAKMDEIVETPWRMYVAALYPDHALVKRARLWW